MRGDVNDWRIYRGVGRPHEEIRRLPDPPPWRDFAQQPTNGTDAGAEVPEGAGQGGRAEAADTARRLGVERVQRRMAESLYPHAEEVEAVNAALYLRRPLLVTGSPGTGKSTLAHAVAHELGLGRVLRWPIVSRSTLSEGLYTYDALARLQDVQLDRAIGAEPVAPPPVGSYIRLGPLGTALLPSADGLPRVLLIDEFDKCDIDLPNDLLNVLEEGRFRIPELARAAEREPVAEVLTDDGGHTQVHDGRVACDVFPFIVLTSNGERDFPPAMLRRCIHLELKPPGERQLAAMVEAHLGAEAVHEGGELIRRFLNREPGSLVATDQLLNALYLTQRAAGAEALTRERLAEMLLRPLDETE